MRPGECSSVAESERKRLYGRHGYSYSIAFPEGGPPDTISAMSE